MPNLTFNNNPPIPNYSAPLLNFMGGGQQQGQGQGAPGGGSGGLKPLQIGGQTFADKLRAFLNPGLQPGYTPGAPMDLGQIAGPGAASFNPMDAATAIY